MINRFEQTFNLLIIEDDKILNDFILHEAAHNCQRSWDRVQSATTLTDATHVLSSFRPDAMILDLHLPDGCGYDFVEMVAQINPYCSILVLTGQIDQYSLPDHLLNNIHMIINKADGLQALRKGLWSLRQCVSPNHLDLTKLSPRQLEMLRMIGKGMDTAQIAELMGVTFSTAQTHRRQITSRLGIHGIDLILFARSLPPDE